MDGAFGNDVLQLLKLIVDMGFTQAQGEAAIKVSDGDFQKAMDLLLTGSITSDPQLNDDKQKDYDDKQKDYEDKLYEDKTEENLGIAPELPLRWDENDSVQYEHSEEPMPPVVLQRRQSIFDDPRKYKNEEAPTIITPTDTTFLENYFVFMVVIIHEIPLVRNIMLQKGFETYGYRPNWWKDELISVPVDVVRPNATDQTSLRFLLETQRYLAFLDGHVSKRSFAATKSFTRAIPSNVAIALESEFISDVFPVFYLVLSNQLNVLNPDVDATLLFESKIVTNGETNSTSSFQIESEFVRPSLYQSFHNLFWKDDFSDLGSTYFETLSDIVTITYHETNHLFPGIVLEELFYPQIYTKDCIPFMKDILSEHQDIQQKLQHLSNQSSSLISFQGKRINSVLGNSINYIETLSKNNSDETLTSTLADLTNLEYSIKEEVAALKHEEFQLQESYRKTNIMDSDNILKKINELNHLSQVDSDKENKHCDENNPIGDKENTTNNYHSQNITVKNILQEPYILTGVIINECEFYYLLSASNKKFPHVWVHLGYEGDPKTTNFTAEATYFQNIQLHVKNLTKHGLTDTLVLIYAKQAALDDAIDTNIPEPLREFLEKDNSTLEQSIAEADELYESSSESIVGNGVDSDDDFAAGDGEDAETRPIDSELIITSTKAKKGG